MPEMNPHLIVLFVALPMAAGIFTLFASGRASTQRVLGLGALMLNLMLALWGLWTVSDGSILVSQMGNWPAPFGITIVLDPLSALMITTAALVSLCVYVYCISQLNPFMQGGMFHPLFHLQIFGVQWSFITGDLFNLFVAFEIMLLSSYSLFVIGTGKAQMRQAYKYVLLNLVGSTLFVTCAGMLYGQLGTLNMADIARISLAGELPARSLPLIAMFLIVFGGKTAIFPLWYWLPDSYHTLPAGLVALFAGLLTKVGAYVMIRVFVMMFGQSPDVMHVLTPAILVSAGVTMFLGVLGAVSMHSVRRILAIHIISQIGYIVLGIGLATQLAVAAAIFFILHNMVVKTALFLCGGLMQAHAGSDDLESIGGLVKRAPWLATLFFLASMSLAGLPPLSGFFGKYVLIEQAYLERHWWLATLAIATSLLTLLSMLKIWSYGFWSTPQGQYVDQPGRRPVVAGGMVSTAVLVVVALTMGFAAPWYMKLSTTAAGITVDPRPYIAAVLGPQHVPQNNPEPAHLSAHARLEVER